MKLATFFLTHPVFTGKELTEHLSSHGEVGGRAKEALLAYHRKAGRVVRVRRGLYAVIPPGSIANSYPINLFLVAAKLTKDAVLSHHTALEFHGGGYSFWWHLIYSASRPLRPLTFRSHFFRGTRFPQALLRAGNEHFGVLTSEIAGVDVLVASLDRTLVDVLDRPDLSGGWDEIWQSLELVEYFDLDKVVEYALLLENASTAAKVGFYLEQHREELRVEDRHLNALHGLRPRQPHYLDRCKRTSVRLVPEWNLVVPTELLEPTWEGLDLLDPTLEWV
jgi:predicted transcriptional regulator of viral defense system